MKRIVVLLALALTALGPQARAGAPIALAGKSILIVQAHPDDEQVIAPLLADACRFQGARCHFLVAAEGHSLGCALARTLTDPEACSTRRREEMAASAKLLGGSVEFFGWPDLFYSHDQSGLTRNLAGWAQAAGGRDHLIDRLAAVLDQRKPDLIFALDPRHGSSCHPNHRAVSVLLVEALARRPDLHPQVWFEQTSDLDEGLSPARATLLEDGAVFAWPANRAPLIWYDADARLADRRPAYVWRAAVHATHATQDRDAATSAVQPAGYRRIPFASLADIDPAQDLCTDLHLARPTFDRPGNLQRILARAPKP